MKKLKDVQVSYCANLAEIQFSSVFKSLDNLSIEQCNSFKRLVYMGEAGDDNNESANELINCKGCNSFERWFYAGDDNNEYANELINYERRLLLPSRASEKLQHVRLMGSNKIFEIQVVGTSESWEWFPVGFCSYLQSLDSLSNLKNLKLLCLTHIDGLQVVKGLEELGCLDNLSVWKCISLERLIDVSSTKFAK